MIGIFHVKSLSLGKLSGYCLLKGGGGSKIKKSSVYIHISIGDKHVLIFVFGRGVGWLVRCSRIFCFCFGFFWKWAYYV